MIRDISIIYTERGICTLVFEWVWRYPTVALDYRNTSLRLSPFPYFRLFIVLLTLRLSRAHLVVVCYNTYQAPPIIVSTDHEMLGFEPAIPSRLEVPYHLANAPDVGTKNEVGFEPTVRDLQSLALATLATRSYM